MSGGSDHSLLQCRGCETIFYLEVSWNSDETKAWYDHTGKVQHDYIRTKVTYPRSENRKKPPWLLSIGKVDPRLQRNFKEMYAVCNSQAYILTTSGLRAALDRGTEVLGIDAAHTVNRKLVELLLGGWIGTKEHDILSVITDAGNAAAHCAWSPGEKEITQLVYAMETFLRPTLLIISKDLAIKNNTLSKRKCPKALAFTETA